MRVGSAPGLDTPGLGHSWASRARRSSLIRAGPAGARFPFDRIGASDHNDTVMTEPCRLSSAGRFRYDLPGVGLRTWTGEVPEWLKGTDCKSVGSAYVGSKPTLSTIFPKPRDRFGALGARWDGAGRRRRRWFSAADLQTRCGVSLPLRAVSAASSGCRLSELNLLDAFGQPGGRVTTVATTPP